MPQLKNHLLSRLLGYKYDGDELNFTPANRRNVLIVKDTPENDNENDNPHPYWYARILGIFHMNIRYVGANPAVSKEPQQMDVLFVRWFGRNFTLQAGWKAKRLFR